MPNGVWQPRIKPGSQELASCSIATRPPFTSILTRATESFDVFHGSCYIPPPPPPRARRPARVSNHPLLSVQCIENRIRVGVRGDRSTIPPFCVTGLLKCFMVPVTMCPFMFYEVWSSSESFRHTFYWWSFFSLSGCQFMLHTMWS